jgi:hypothetical protein
MLPIVCMGNDSTNRLVDADALLLGLLLLIGVALCDLLNPFDYYLPDGLH